MQQTPEYRFQMDLAWAFRRADKDRFLAEVSSFEMCEWAAYFELVDDERAADEKDPDKAARKQEQARKQRQASQRQANKRPARGAPPPLPASAPTVPGLTNVTAHEVSSLAEIQAE